MPVPVNKNNTSRIAQSFYVDKDNGIFVTDIGLFFKATPAGTGFPVYVTIRSMENGVPHGYVYMAKAEASYATIDASTSDDATAEVKFSFPSPVYLAPFRYYAFTVETNSSEYELYYSEIYDHILNSTERLVDKNPVSGSLFYSQNGVTWSENQDQDLKFKVYKANWSNYYSNGQTISVKLGNKDVSTRRLQPNAIETDGTTTFYVKHPNHGFQEGDEVTISGVTSSTNYVGGIHIDNINGKRNIKSGAGNVAARDWQGYLVEAGTGTSNTTLVTEIGGGDAIYAERNILYTAFVPTVDVLTGPNTGTTFGVKTMTAGKNPYNSEAGAYNRDASYSQLRMKKTNYMRTQPGMIANKTMEATNTGTETYNNKSLEISVDMSSSDTANVMPMVDMERANVAFMLPAIDNPSLSINSSSGQNMIINPIAETLPEGGTALAKHITKIFPLENTAVGIKLFLAANVPSGTAHTVYYKAGDLDANFSDISWTLIAPQNSPPNNERRGLYKDYEYLIGGEAGLDTPFQKFQFKIVMTSNNAVKYPIIRELRAIALGV